jgi:hypothetical protein
LHFHEENCESLTAPYPPNIPCFFQIFCSGFFFVCVCVVLGFELRTYTLSHSTSPFFGDGFLKIRSLELFGLDWSRTNPPDKLLRLRPE